MCVLNLGAKQHRPSACASNTKISIEKLTKAIAQHDKFHYPHDISHLYLTNIHPISLGHLSFQHPLK